MNTRLLTTTILCCLVALNASAQTAVSLFWKSDSLQITEAHSASGVEYKTIGHHGPAVENSHMALRLYFNHSGAIDVYSKAKTEPELLQYAWYPSEAQIAAGAGCDEYRVGRTVGLGGISLWDGEHEVKLEATRGRDVSVNKTKHGAEMQMTARGVVYKGDTVDIRVTVTVNDKDRLATIEARCLTGQKVIFMSGINHHKGQSLDFADGRLAAWGIHPADVVKNPLPIGGGMYYNAKKWTSPTKTDDMLRITTRKAVKKASTQVVAACSREANLNNEKAFFDFVRSMK